MAEDKRQEEARKAAIARAQALEKRGQADAAIQAFMQANAPDDAARVMIGQRRFGEAAQLLLDSVGLPPEAVNTLDAPKRKLALQAAICLGRAGDATRAAIWFVALGERDRAAEALRRSGDRTGADRVVAGGPVVPPTTVPTPTNNVAPTAGQTLEAQGNFELALEAYTLLRQSANAARMAVKLGRFTQAAEMYATAGMNYEAAEAYWRAGASRQSLDCLMRVPKDDARYRQCCLLVARLATDLDVLDFQLDHFLSRFLSDMPRDERELEAFYQAGRLYQRHDHLENAKDAFRKVLSISPGYRDARAQLDAVEAEGRGSSMMYEKILREEAAFRSNAGQPSGGGAAATMAGLPTCLRLPSLPPTPAATDAFATVARSGLTPPPGRSPMPMVRSSGPPKAPAAPRASGSNPTAPAASEPSLVIGSVVAERYRLEAKIGQGGMASVFRAHDSELNEKIALKVFTQVVDDEQLVARFKQELTLSRQLAHPNIIRLYDIGAVQGFRYITMELLSGTDLKSKLGQPIDVQTGVGFLLQTCAALQHVHERGVVHRDIKPANLFLTDDGTIKLMDFGIAKREATPGLTVAGMIAGTPEYMSPEQINGFEKVSASTDLYALGIMAYEIFTGSVPFRHKDLMPLLMMQMNERPPAPSSRNPHILRDLEEIILKLLEKDPARRFISCNELSGALQLL